MLVTARESMKKMRRLICQIDLFLNLVRRTKNFKQKRKRFIFEVKGKEMKHSHFEKNNDMEFVNLQLGQLRL